MYVRQKAGYLVVYRKNNDFSIDDIILTEYGATVIGLAMQRAESEENSEEHHKEHDIYAAKKHCQNLKHMR